MICKICDREFKSKKGLAYHLKIKHKLNLQEYYDLYLFKENDNKCKDFVINNNTFKQGEWDESNQD